MAALLRRTRALLRAGTRLSQRLCTAALLAVLLTWLGGPAQLAQEAFGAERGCCCAHRGSHECRCPVCSERRASDSPVPLLRSCGGQPGGEALPTAVRTTPALPPRPATLPPLGPRLPVDTAPALPVQAPPPDIPTPPPLA